MQTIEQRIISRERSPFDRLAILTILRKRNFVTFFFLALFGCTGQKTEAPPEQVLKPSEPVIKCTWQVTEVSPGWTAYKYSEKAAVSGTFKDYVITGNGVKTSLTDSLLGVEVSIVPRSVESMNPSRNITIAEKFFAIFLSPETITGQIVGVNGDDKKGSIDLKLAMNGKEKTLAFPYSVSEKGDLTAEKSIEMAEFGLTPAWESIHKACEVLHTGKDGVSKTWTEVLLRIGATVQKTCK